MRSFLSFHVKPPPGSAPEASQEPLANLAALVRPWLGGEGLGAYLVPDTPWVSLYLEALEAQEDPKAVLAFLLELSSLGEALAFMVLNEEDLLFARAEGGELKALFAQGEEVEPQAFGLDEALSLALKAPPVAAVMRAAGVLGLHPDHAALGFLDLLETEEEGGLPEGVLYLEGEG